MSRIKIELEKVLKERKISKNQLCYACKLQHSGYIGAGEG